MIDIAVVTGGDSLEADSSLRSAENVYHALEGTTFRRYLISFGNGQWRLLRGDGLRDEDLARAEFNAADFSFTISPGGMKIRFSAAFIAIHGEPAETGHLQGYLELTGIPYTGSGVLASALAMDKHACKGVLSHLPSIRFPRHCYFEKATGQMAGIVERELGFPCIIKPNAQGSGIGVSIVSNPTALDRAAGQIAGLGRGILVEQFIPGRELTVGAVILDNGIVTLPVAEVFRPDHERELRQTGQSGFTNRQSAEIRIDPQLDDGTARLLGESTRAIGRALRCRSFFRADYILSENGQVWFLEINTIPGMTPDSVFTRQVLAGGYSEPGLYRKLILEVLEDRVA